MDILESIYLHDEHKLIIDNYKTFTLFIDEEYYYFITHKISSNCTNFKYIAKNKDNVSIIRKFENFKFKDNYNNGFIYVKTSQDISAKKFNRSISVIKKYFSDRKILICKEITKYFEEHFRFNVSELDQKNISLKGEITLVLSEKKIVNKTSNNLSESDKTKIRKLIKKLSIKEIVDLIKDGKNIPKKEIYNYCLKIKNEN